MKYFKKFVLKWHVLGLSLDELVEQYTERNGMGKYCCKLCGKYLRDRTDAKRHIESKHFPTNGAYICPSCSKSLNTYSALKCHLKQCIEQTQLN